MFAARSTKGITRLSFAERALITIPEGTKDVLVGILLGDAHISRRSLTANSRLIYGQTMKHEEYFKYVYNIFKPFCSKDYIPQYKTIKDLRTNEVYTSVLFITMQLPCFNVFREMFYVSGKKIIPTNINSLLTPRGLAF
jgi:hypothetical protein